MCMHMCTACNVYVMNMRVRVRVRVRVHMRVCMCMWVIDAHNKVKGLRVDRGRAEERAKGEPAAGPEGNASETRGLAQLMAPAKDAQYSKEQSKKSREGRRRDQIG
jgi:hypothetical protein